jgi:CheY-like chemotaxis protein
MRCSVTSPESERGRRTILVAEDEDNVRLMIAAVLRQRGFEPLLCHDGQDALERLQSATGVDAALIDIRMPRVNGIELMTIIRAQPQWSALPIVAMSAYNDELQEREVREAGANAFLAKPFTLADLVSALDDLLPAGGGHPPAA